MNPEMNALLNCTGNVLIGMSLIGQQSEQMYPVLGSVLSELAADLQSGKVRDSTVDVVGAFASAAKAALEAEVQSLFLGTCPRTAP